MVFWPAPSFFLPIQIPTIIMSFINSAEEWQTVFDQSPIGIAFKDNTGKFTKVNAKLCSILEYSESELTEMNFRDVTHPKDTEPEAKSFRKVENASIPGFEMVKRYITKTGKMVWARLTLWPVYKDNRLIHFVAHIQPLHNGDIRRVEQEENNRPARVERTIWRFLWDFILHNWKTIGAIITAGVITITNFYWSIKTNIEKTEKLEKMVIELIEYVKRQKIE